MGCRMTRPPQASSTILLLIGVCLLLVVPVELHATLVEVGAHDVEGPISVDARHADQRAHFEHSAVVVHGRCGVCAPPHETRALELRIASDRSPVLPTGRLTPFDFCHSNPKLVIAARGRAPPLL